MNRLFGQSKPNAVPKSTLSDTAATLDTRVETINKQIAQLDQELQAYSRLPPAKKASQKSRAMTLLNRKKMYEKQRATIEGQSSNIGATNFALENTKIQREIFNGLRDAKQQMVKGSKELNPDKVDDLMADLDDNIRDQDEMNDIFSRPFGQDAYTTDADLESELAGLAESEFEMNSTDIYSDLHAPSVPVHTIAAPYSTASTRGNNARVDQYGLPILPENGMRN